MVSDGAGLLGDEMTPDRINQNLELRLIALRQALEQIARLAREADRSKVDVASMLGEIAVNALSKPID